MKYIVEIELTEGDGAAHAIVTLHHPVHGRFFSAADVSSHGSIHTADLSGVENRREYVDAWRALQGGVRHVMAQVERDWNEHARQHGTGAR